MTKIAQAYLQKSGAGHLVALTMGAIMLALAAYSQMASAADVISD
ncbi:hypothetical protein [Rhizobium mayense]|uniref:Uncharacterized protein n=1 Tax=Rhizobium mayense TaxID=1312184 RepID=A0ABT7JQX8_9HYPH|nr:hypothetical protein [Rhizobium mayense]MDL2398163.1 hypothetical protein [Rhizobium mayense]